MSKFTATGAVALLLLLPTSLTAQQSAGAIAGTVRDTTGAVVPGVTVEASSPALIEKVKSVTTDGEGQYKIVDLRPGSYTVTFTLTGFTVVKREGIELAGGFTAPVNAELKPGSLEETVIVAGSSPTVDVQSVMQSHVTTRADLETIPTGEFFSNIAQLIPGLQVIQLPLTSAQQDVGGSAGWAAIKVALHGGLATDQQMFLNGYSITNLSGEGAQTSEVPIEANTQEYNIATSGHPAEAETGGVRVNIVPRTGGNQFSGGMYFNFTNESLQSDNLSTDLQKLGLKTISKVKSIWMASPYVGGPIKQDKIWFFGSAQRTITDNYAVGFENADPSAWVFVPNLNRPSTTSTMLPAAAA